MASFEKDISYADYCELPGLRTSDLKLFAQCPETYYKTRCGLMPPRPGTEAMQFGRDVEKALEYYPVRLEIDATIIPDDVLSKSGSRAGGAWKAFEELHAGKRLLKKKDYDALAEALTQVCEQVEEHPEAQALLRCCDWQVAKTWKCDQTGLKLKGLIDCHHDSWIIDVKTTAHISPRAFLRQAIQLKYHWQAAAYLEQTSSYCSTPTRAVGHGVFIFLAIQNVPPYRVELYRMDEDLLAHARNELIAYRAMYLDYMETRDATWRSKTHGQIYTLPTEPWMLREEFINGE